MRKVVFARPLRSFKQVMKYLRPRRLTLKHNLRVHAWLWWNF